jgi:hypothetical protein
VYLCGTENSIDRKMLFETNVSAESGLSFLTSIPPSLMKISYGAAGLGSEKDKNNPE